MNNVEYALRGGALGYIAGEATYHGGLEVGFKTTVATIGWGIQLLAFSPFILGLIPTLKIAKQINAKYEDSPLQLVTAHFLLFSSYVILTDIIHLSIMAAFVSSLNPITLPIMIAAGVTASLMIGLYFLTKPAAQGPSMVRTFCAFFQKCRVSDDKAGSQANENQQIIRGDKYPVSHGKPVEDAFASNDQQREKSKTGEKYPVSHGKPQQPAIEQTDKVGMLVACLN